jgi:hypothetical protein
MLLRATFLALAMVVVAGVALVAVAGSVAVEAKPTPVAGAKNLVPNGNFEEGDDSPKGWQTVDGLTTFWVNDEDPRHGKVIKFDTDVYQEQGYDWWVKIARKQARAKDAPKKKPTVGDKYDTLAGLDGVWFWSDFMPVEKGNSYWLSLDVKGPGLLAWLVGYARKESTAFGADAAAFQEVLQEKVTGRPKDARRGFEGFIHKYVWKGQLAAGGSDEWRTYERRAKPFRPTAVTPEVKYVRVLILPTWPPATYYVDNVRLVEVENNPAAGK